MDKKEWKWFKPTMKEGIPINEKDQDVMRIITNHLKTHDSFILEDIVKKVKKKEILIDMKEAI